MSDNSSLQPYMIIPEPVFNTIQESKDEKVQKACQSVNIRQLNTLNVNRTGEGLSKEDILGKVQINLTDKEGIANVQYEQKREEEEETELRRREGEGVAERPHQKTNPIQLIPFLIQSYRLVFKVLIRTRWLLKRIIELRRFQQLSIELYKMIK